MVETRQDQAPLGLGFEYPKLVWGLKSSITGKFIGFNPPDVAWMPTYLSEKDALHARDYAMWYGSVADCFAEAQSFADLINKAHIFGACDGFILFDDLNGELGRFYVR